MQSHPFCLLKHFPRLDTSWLLSREIYVQFLDGPWNISRAGHELIGEQRGNIHNWHWMLSGMESAYIHRACYLGNLNYSSVNLHLVIAWYIGAKSDKYGGNSAFLRIVMKVQPLTFCLFHMCYLKRQKLSHVNNFDLYVKSFCFNSESTHLFVGWVFKCAPVTKRTSFFNQLTALMA